MSRVTKITVLMGKTINLGNYESARVDYGEEVVLSEDDILSEEITRTINNVRGSLAEAIEKSGMQKGRK